MIVGIWSVESIFKRTLSEILSELGFEVRALPLSFREARSELLSGWPIFDFLICVAPLPLCMRLISGFPKSKYADPAVIHIDPGSRLVTCLCGEHFRGGAQLAKLLSNYLGLRVRETSKASRLHLITLDELCFRLRLSPLDFRTLSRYVKFQCKGARVELRARGHLYDAINSLLSTSRYYVLVRDSSICEREVLCKLQGEPTLVLKAKTLVLGIGMCTCAGVDDFMFVLRHALSLFGMPTCRIDIACLPESRKEHEIVRLISSLGLKVVFSKVNILSARPVAEYLACSILPKSRLLIRKVRGKHVTVALAEECEER